MCNVGSNLRAEDPRVLVVDDDIELWWTDGFKQYHAKLDLVFDDSGLLSASVDDIVTPKPPFIPEIEANPNYDGRQKNWVPFDHGYIYSFSPFVIYVETEVPRYPSLLHHKIINIPFYPRWKYGFIKGGTPAIPYGDEYLTIFHSTKKYNDVNFYFAGALTFTKDSLTPNRISRYPIIAPYPDDDPERHNTSYVVFPAGIIIEDDVIYISYGYNDHAIKIHACSKNDLEWNLRDLDPVDFTPYPISSSENTCTS
jgi:predicted GH43/DUF377 family glycosyl hydrolase